MSVFPTWKVLVKSLMVVCVSIVSSEAGGSSHNSPDLSSNRLRPVCAVFCIYEYILGHNSMPWMTEGIDEDWWILIFKLTGTSNNQHLTLLSLCCFSVEHLLLLQHRSLHLSLETRTGVTVKVHKNTWLVRTKGTLVLCLLLYIWYELPIAKSSMCPFALQVSLQFSGTNLHVSRTNCSCLYK